MELALALFLNENDVKALLQMSDALDVLEIAIREQGRKIAVNSPRQTVRTPAGAFSILPAAVPGLKSMGFKTYTASPDGARFWLLLFGDRGDLQAIMEAEHWACWMRHRCCMVLRPNT